MIAASAASLIDIAQQNPGADLSVLLKEIIEQAAQRLANAPSPLPEAQESWR